MFNMHQGIHTHQARHTGGQTGSDTGTVLQTMFQEGDEARSPGTE